MKTLDPYKDRGLDPDPDSLEMLATDPDPQHLLRLGWSQPRLVLNKLPDEFVQNMFG